MRVERLRRLGPWPGRYAMLLPELILRVLLIPWRAGNQVSWRARVGPGLWLPHPTGVIFGPLSRIGSDVTILQQVTLGRWRGHAPCLRSRSSIFAGAKLLGDVVVGRRAFVGANAVLTVDVPDWHTAVGVPATVRARSDAPQWARSVPPQPRLVRGPIVGELSGQTLPMEPGFDQHETWRSRARAG